jgi:hypothetical protein
VRLWQFRQIGRTGLVPLFWHLNYGFCIHFRVGIADLNSRIPRCGVRNRCVDLSGCTEAERRAAFINIYNSLIIHGLIVCPSPTSFLSRLTFFTKICYDLGGQVFSLDDIEHGILRGNRATPLTPSFLSRTYFRAHVGRRRTSGKQPSVHAVDCRLVMASG